MKRRQESDLYGVYKLEKEKKGSREDVEKSGRFSPFYIQRLGEANPGFKAEPLTDTSCPLVHTS
jgi:hypothetical protein